MPSGHGRVGETTWSFAQAASGQRRASSTSAAASCGTPQTEGTIVDFPGSPLVGKVRKARTGAANDGQCRFAARWPRSRIVPDQPASLAREQRAWLSAVLVVIYAYYGITGNIWRLRSIVQVMRIWHKWFWNVEREKGLLWANSTRSSPVIRASGPDHPPLHQLERISRVRTGWGICAPDCGGEGERPRLPATVLRCKGRSQSAPTARIRVPKRRAQAERAQGEPSNERRENRAKTARPIKQGTRTSGSTRTHRRGTWQRE